IMLGLESVAGRASAADQQALWTQADHNSAQFTHGLLRGVDGTLRSRFRWGAADVKWEATFTGGTASGMVIRLANGIDPTAAISAGVGPLKGAAYDAQRHLITKGTVAVGQESWGSDPAMLAVAGEPAASTYVAKGCSAATVAPGTRLKPVAAYSVGIGDGLATVWIGEDREDLFERMRLGDGVPAYRQTFISPVGDPTAGRMGFKVSSPVAAADLVARQPLPFAACG
ncbi:MAG: hypothetical protein J2O46_06610, partial [Nocardioides sp.]|nr:hypothetical protein [Nocardioides sp.]